MALDLWVAACRQQILKKKTILAPCPEVEKLLMPIFCVSSHKTIDETFFTLNTELARFNKLMRLYL
jgi:hypothetical protein